MGATKAAERSEEERPQAVARTRPRNLASISLYIPANALTSFHREFIPVPSPREIKYWLEPIYLALTNWYIQYYILFSLR
jgi:hypothetical protein